MKQKRVTARSQEDIDAEVVAQSETDAAWDKPVEVRRKAESVSLPAELARRAAFVARLHRRGVAQWLASVIEERLDLEEAAFAGAKRELKTHAIKG